ncbi:DUF3298 domain-containing protein [Virgibacillus halophilus]|uniref:DUF3298 domain-containing protein n=1 Tax=Tigheibacillus halophilus TaxID=361280 RepID=A0ABU5C757_9BACI|nr:DUF3298 domain-containing protein [Virgibacillus halophilus]
MAAIAFPVSIQTFVLDRGSVKIYYPQVFGMQDLTIQQSINQKILQLTQTVIQEQYQQQQMAEFDQIVGSFEIKNNQRNILSLTISNYAIAKQAAHGLTIMKSLTFDLLTGKIYQLPALFKKESNYIEILSNHIKAQIKKRHIPVIEDFNTISSHQDFYIADRTLVLYFQPYDLTPYYYGFTIFPISVYALTNIINDDSPLAVMAANS